jgi:hypothetical protein
MRPALLRACTLSFCTRAASRFAPCLAAARERYREWRNPQTFTCQEPARSTTSILIFLTARLLLERTGRVHPRRYKIPLSSPERAPMLHRALR